MYVNLIIAFILRLSEVRAGTSGLAKVAAVCR